MKKVVKDADGIFKARSPYCDESFTADSELEALKKEGDHRGKHLDTESSVTKKTHNRNVGRRGNKSVVNGVNG